MACQIFLSDVFADSSNEDSRARFERHDPHGPAATAAREHDQEGLNDSTMLRTSVWNVVQVELGCAKPCGIR